MKNNYWIGGTLIFLGASFVVWTGVGQGQSSVTLDSLNRQVQTLQTTVQNQERRIAALEQKLSQVSPPSQPSQNPSTIPPSSTQPAQQPGWHLPANWARIQRGMSRQQVEAILGKPARVRDFASITLYFEGEVAGSGFVLGTVELFDGRVVTVSPPVFLR